MNATNEELTLCPFLNLIARGLINMIGCVIASVGCCDLLMALQSGWVIAYSTYKLTTHGVYFFTNWLNDFLASA